MFRALQAWNPRPAHASPPWLAVWLAVLASLLLLAGCSGMGDLGAGSSTSAPPPASANIGTGKVKVGLILPLSASGNAAVAAQSMRNAAEMALAEFNNPDLQLLVKDDGGNAQGAQQVAQQVLDEGAEIILGPLFALTVGPVGRVARARNIPVIAFSTDANVAARGVYLLSFLPESDVERIIGYAAGQGRRSFAALIPDNAYGSVAEGAFKQAVARRDGRVVALERYPTDKAKMQAPVKTVAQAALGASRADAIFIPDGAEAVPALVQMLIANGIDPKRVQLLGTGLWEDPQIFSSAPLDGAWYAGPELDRLSQLLRPLPQPLWAGSGAHRLARLRRGRAGRGAGENPGPAALFGKRADHGVRLHRHRRIVPLPSRRHQPARARGDEGVAHRRPDHQPAAKGLRRVGDVDKGVSRALRSMERESAE